MRKHYKICHSLFWCMLLAGIGSPLLSIAQDKVYANAQKLNHQSGRDDYRPLLEVLNEIKEHYNVSFLYEPVT